VYRGTYYTHIWNKRVYRSLKKVCLGPEIKNMVRDMEELARVWISKHLL
jgi:hypothetical protein